MTLEYVQHMQYCSVRVSYECETFACALSAPVATLLREKAIMLLLAERHAPYEDGECGAGGGAERRRRVVTARVLQAR